MMATVLSANPIVREKESGTLEQFYMTPVRRFEVIIGKMIPYVVQAALDSMPDIFRAISYFIPTTWLIDESRGIILRGTDWSTLWQHAAALWLMAIVVTRIGAVRMRKQLV